MIGILISLVVLGLLIFGFFSPVVGSIVFLAFVFLIEGFLTIVASRQSVSTDPSWSARER